MAQKCVASKNVLSDAGSATVGGQNEAKGEGEYTPIQNLSEPPVPAIAEFAVAAHNMKTNAKLKLVEVIEGASQIVAGTNYRLRLRTNDGILTRSYLTVVYVNLDQTWKLISFLGIERSK